MKKNIIAYFIIVVSLLSFSCKDSTTNNDYLVSSREISFEDETENLREELIFYTMAENYKLSEEAIENDISSFLALQMTNTNLDLSRTISITKENYDITKVKGFKRNLSTKHLSRAVDTTDEVNFSIYNIYNKETESKELAITSDDERLGSLLCVLANIDYVDSVEEDPIMEMFLERLDYYVEEVNNELETITEDDFESFKKKYGITEDDIAQAKLEYENSQMARKFWGYDSWSTWTVNDINLNNLSEKTKWDQGYPYNSAIKVMEGALYYTGCGSTAVAQIMAYHSWPNSYTRSDLETLKNKWTLASSWDGNYDWNAMTTSPYANNLSTLGKICVGALMYDVSKGCKSDYGLDGTSSNMSNRISYLRSIGYSCDNSKNYSYNAISDSLRKDSPVMIRGGGHAWIIDGSLELIRTRNYYVFWIPFKSKEYQNYVHCNYGWSGSCDDGTTYTYKGEGYYKSGIFETSNGNLSDNLVICTNIKPNK